MTPRSSCPGGESTPLQGANLRLNYEINNVTDTALGNLARGKPSFCRSDRCLSYRPPGSLLESRGGSILARAEAALPSARGQSERTRGTRHPLCARFLLGRPHLHDVGRMQPPGAALARSGRASTALAWRRPLHRRRSLRGRTASVAGPCSASVLHRPD